MGRPQKRQRWTSEILHLGKAVFPPNLSPMLAYHLLIFISFLIHLSCFPSKTIHPSIHIRTIQSINYLFIRFFDTNHLISDNPFPTSSPPPHQERVLHRAAAAAHRGAVPLRAAWGGCGGHRGQLHARRRRVRVALARVPHGVVPNGAVAKVRVDVRDARGEQHPRTRCGRHAGREGGGRHRARQADPRAQGEQQELDADFHPAAKAADDPVAQRLHLVRLQGPHPDRGRREEHIRLLHKKVRVPRGKLEEVQLQVVREVDSA